MTLHLILVYRHAARTHVVRNFAIVSMLRPEGRGGGGGILKLSHKRGVIFKIPTFGEGQIFHMPELVENPRPPLSHK